LISWVLRLIRSLVDALPVGKLYEAVLENQVTAGPMPSHIGLILDGNRRWARQRHLSEIEGHAEGAKKLEQVLSWFRELNIETVTLYVLSTENLSRSPEEVSGILSVVERYLTKAIAERTFEKEGVRVRFLGERGLLPAEITKLMESLEHSTSKNDRAFLNVAMGYGGRMEIVQAVRKMVSLATAGALSPEEVNEKLIGDFLYTAYLPNPDPDLIIRTSGEMRVSNFLLWQSAYSELFFLEVNWPDFRRIDLLRAIRSYQGRERRYGR
jgi:tritrans,polycis-undecaprenyl-diphosphate synthase [geranylgeranyl-diphosphate specific]